MVIFQKITGYSVNKLGHYAKKAAKAAIRPVNLAITLVIIGAALSCNPIKAQEGDAFAN